jgi:simple sugar transport system permease protein
VVLISGGIDISFTATASVAQYVAMTVANAYGLDWFSVFALACAVGVVCGLVNALLIDTLKISSIIVTIATLNIFYGLLVFATGGKYIYSLPDWFSKGIWWFEYIDKDQIPYGINLQILIVVLAFLITWLLLNRTNIGRQIYALGGNRDAAQRLGFNVLRLNLLVYGYMGFMAGMASLVQAQLAQSVAPTVLVGKELDVLAAVVLGGASLMGGVGTVLGTILGVVLLAIMQNGLVLVGVSSYWSQFFVGLVILVSVSTTALSMLRKRRARSVTA